MRPPFEKVENAADQAATHHLYFIQSLRSMERELLASASALTARGLRELKRDMEQFLDSYEENVKKLLQSDLMSVVSEVEGGHEQIVSANLLFGVDEIVNQGERDVSQILKRHRNLAISAQIEAQARGVSVETALFDKKIQSLNEISATWFTDRAGRKIASQKHIRRLYRALLLETHRKSFASSLALRGELTARIAHANPSHRAFGQVVHLDGQGAGIEDYEDVFHPNTDAYLISESSFMEQYA